MHARDEVIKALDLAADGLSPTAIARLTGIPRSTIRDWVAGRTPRSARRVNEAADSAEHCSRCGGARHEWDRLPPEYVYLLGIYLGDGCISQHPRTHRLRIALDSGYPQVIERCVRAIESVLPQNKVGVSKRPYNCVDVSAYSRAWPCLLPQHGAGKKHERKIELTAWQRTLVDKSPHLLLVGLIHSDGCRFINTGRNGWSHPRYTFTNVSLDIRRIYCDACTQLGLHWTFSKPRTIYVSRKSDVAKLDAFGAIKT